MGLRWGGLSDLFSQAFGYIESAVRSGIEHVGSVVESITTSFSLTGPDYVRGVELSEEAMEKSSLIANLPPSYMVPETMATPSGFDWREQHVMKMGIMVQDRNTKEISTQWITVESSAPQTLQTWQSMGQEAVTQSWVGYDWEVLDYMEYEYLMREETGATGEE